SNAFVTRRSPVQVWLAALLKNADCQINNQRFSLFKAVVRIKKLFFSFPLFPTYHNRTDGIYLQKEWLTEADSFLYTHKHISKQTYLFNYPTVQKKLHCVERINKQGILLMYDTQKYFRNLPNTIFISTFEF
ncbi:MAG: hypothetical protein ACLT8K_03330, partial [Bacteroides stercoris]